MSPSEEDREECPAEQSPLQWPLDDEDPEDKEEQDKGSHIHGTCREGLISPVVVQTTDDLPIVSWHTLHSGEVLPESTRCPSIDIRYEQGKGLALAIAPGCDVVLV